jgi:hypothetical protein
MKINFPRLLMPFIFFFFAASSALACTCIDFGPADKALDEARNVVVLKAVAQLGVNGEYAGGFRFAVQKVFKGKLKPGQEFAVVSIGGCGPSFSPEDLGREFLIFYHDDETSLAPGCGATKWVGRAAGDLSYLENLDQVRGLTRLSGIVSQRFPTALEGEKDREVSLEGHTVRVTGNGRDMRLKTDKNGLFEVYGLPPGQYRVEPERIKGYSITDGDYDPINSFATTIFNKAHTETDLRFSIVNEVRGKLVDAAGSPLGGVMLHLVPALGKARQYFSNAAISEKDGSFRFHEIPAGKYVIVGNPGNEITAEYPYPRFYSSGTDDRQTAVEITIGAGEFLEGFTVKAPPPAETVTISGRLLFEDGTPVRSETVKFFAGAAEVEKAPGNVTAYTDKDGNFRLKILKGQKGTVHASLYPNTYTYRACLDRLNAVKTKAVDKSGRLETPRRPLDASADMTGFDLKFDFSLCN